MQIFRLITFVFSFLLYGCLGDGFSESPKQNKEGSVNEGLSYTDYQRMINKYLVPVVNYKKDSISLDVIDSISYQFQNDGMIFKGVFIRSNYWAPIEVFESGMKKVTMDVQLFGNVITPKQFLYFDSYGEVIKDSSFYQIIEYLDSNTLRFQYEPINRKSDCYLIVSDFSVYNFEARGGDSLVIDLKVSNYDVEIPLTPSLLKEGEYFTGVIIEQRPETGAVKRIGVFDHPKFNDVGNNNKRK